jgi:hypothetical protein
MRYVSSERLLDVVGLVLVGAAAASALTAVLKPSEFRAKSERIARLHQLEAMTAQAQPRTLTMATAGGLVTVSVTPLPPVAARAPVNATSAWPDGAVAPHAAMPAARSEAGFVEHASYQSPSEGVLADAR